MTKIIFLEGNMGNCGGTEKMTSIISNVLGRNDNYEVSIISINNPNGNSFFYLDKSVEHIILSNKKEKMFTLIKKLRLLINKIKPDIIVNVDIGCSIYSLLARIGLNCKIVTWEHSNYYNNWDSTYLKYLRILSAKFSDYIVVLTHQDKENYKKNIKFKTPIMAIYNPIETYGVCEIDNTTILSAGHFNSIKGFDKALKIANSILKTSDWKWVICGDGPEMKKMVSYISEHGLKDKVILPGVVKNMNYYYEKSSIYVSTSKIEGLPMTLLEAKAHSIPIVSFDIMTGPSEIIQDGINGFLIEYDNLDRMNEKITMLMNDSKMRHEFSNNSYIDIEKFSIEYIEKKWIKLINDVLKK